MSGLFKAFGSSTFWVGLLNFALDAASSCFLGQPVSPMIPIVNTAIYGLKEGLKGFGKGGA